MGGKRASSLMSDTRKSIFNTPSNEYCTKMAFEYSLGPAQKDLVIFKERHGLPKTGGLVYFFSSMQ